jgi:hypothetical protein
VGRPYDVPSDFVIAGVCAFEIFVYIRLMHIGKITAIPRFSTMANPMVPLKMTSYDHHIGFQYGRHEI